MPRRHWCLFGLHLALASDAADRPRNRKWDVGDQQSLLLAQRMGLTRLLMLLALMVLLAL